LLCCGDFESVRDERDLDQLAGPPKYHFLKDFHKYYKGEMKAPVLTVFVGGNHEASNFLWELYYGGWVAPNIYYLGSSGVLNYGGIRISGFSGIFKYPDFNKGHYEVPPFDEGTKRSYYHVRTYELFKLKLMKSPLDVVMSHDWPEGVVACGDREELMKRRPHFVENIKNEELGCKDYFALIKSHKPKFWLSGHMHTYFKATIPHADSKTEFLALDKAEHGRPFIDVIEFPNVEGALELRYDREWIAILKATEALYNATSSYVNLPNTSDFAKQVETIKEEMMKTTTDMDFIVPHNFEPTHTNDFGVMNPQTDLFIKKFGLSSIYDKHTSATKLSPSSRRYQEREYSKERKYGESKRGSFGGRGRGRGSSRYHN